MSRPDNQQSEPFEEPPREEIPTISRAHVSAMESMDIDEVWIGAGMHQLILQSVGRRSGTEHKVALPFWVDLTGERLVVGSYAGAPKDPAWVHNLRDRNANPEVTVRVRSHAFVARADILEGEDRQAQWDALTADRPFYLKYQTRHGPAASPGAAHRAAPGLTR